MKFELLNSSILQKPFLFGTNRSDSYDVTHPLVIARLYGGADNFTSTSRVGILETGKGADDVTLYGETQYVSLGKGADTLEAFDSVNTIDAGKGNDTVIVHKDVDEIDLGRGHDSLTVYDMVEQVDGGRGKDTLNLAREAGAFDIAVEGNTFVFIERFTREEMRVENIESFVFEDKEYSATELKDAFGDPTDPFIQVGGGTQVLTVNDASPTVSVMWDRAAQQAVIDTDSPTGPTVASRAYAMTHTAIYDAWSAFDSVAVRVSFDEEGDNSALEAALTGSAGEKAEAMSFAAYTVLTSLFPDQTDLFDTVMASQGLDPSNTNSAAAQLGIDAAEDLLALRNDDGSNQAGGYTGEFTPTNPSPLDIQDITAWTPENVPLDPEDGSPEQAFLTPHWLEVEPFAIAQNPDGTTDFTDTLPPAPEWFFTEEFMGSTLDMAAKTITLAAAVTIDGVTYDAGDVVAVDKSLIGSVINEGFIAQAEEVIDYSANLTDEHKIIAEFWEDGGGTAFPPGTFMGFAQYVSARDDNSLDEDAALFFAMGNAVMDAGIATWQAKVEYDYARPVRAIRDLGELGLIGELGVDEVTGETGYVIDAFGGFDEDGKGIGTKTILAENFITFQRPGADPSPPFAEYTSGHSAFSAAGAEVLKLFTGSDDFGGSVTFAPDTIQFENGVPSNEVTLAWETFSEAADEAGLSRLYGGIHFDDGDINGRTLGREVGADAYDTAMAFVNGEATDELRPFFVDDEFAFL